MKILLIDYARYTNIDGSAKYNYKLAKLFVSLNCKVTHFNIGLSKNILRDEPIKEVIQIDAIYNKRYQNTGGFIKAWRKYRIGVKQLLTHLRNNDYDLIIDSTQIGLRGLSKKLPKNRLWIQHQSFTVLNYQVVVGKFFSRIVYFLTKKIIGVFSNVELVENAVLYTRKDVDSLNRLFKKNNISHKMIIPLTSESFIDTPFNISDRTNSILYVGRLEPFQKQIKKLIKMSKFLDTDIHVYGDGPYLKHVNTNPNRIKYMGTFNNANWKNIYSKYLFTILVSKFEGFSYSLVESISCGTPIITVDSFESSSYLTNDNMNGTLLPYKSSIKSKAKIINDLITNLKEQPHEYINKCNNALNFAKKNLHDSIFTKSWTKIIEMYKKNI